MNAMGFVITAVGLLSAVGGICDWDWFMDHRKARFMCSILTRNGARIFYVVLGLGIATLGILIAMGVIQDKPE